MTARGQVTLSRDVLHHLGIKPGETIALDALSDNHIQLRAATSAGSIDRFFGLLAGKTDKRDDQ